MFEDTPSLRNKCNVELITCNFDVLYKDVYHMLGVGELLVETISYLALQKYNYSTQNQIFHYTINGYIFSSFVYVI